MTPDKPRKHVWRDRYGAIDCRDCGMHHASKGVGDPCAGGATAFPPEHELLHDRVVESSGRLLASRPARTLRSMKARGGVQ